MNFYCVYQSKWKLGSEDDHEACFDNWNVNFAIYYVIGIRLIVWCGKTRVTLHLKIEHFSKSIPPAKMSNLLAFDLVQSLQPEEAAGFRSFLKSEQGHHLFKADHLELLFDILYQYSKTENTAFIEKEVLYEKVFPGKPFVKNKVEKLASDLNTAIRQYLLMQRYFSEDNEMQRQLDWLVELRKDVEKVNAW